MSFIDKRSFFLLYREGKNVFFYKKKKIFCGNCEWYFYLWENVTKILWGIQIVFGKIQIDFFPSLAFFDEKCYFCRTKHNSADANQRRRGKG